MKTKNIVKLERIENLATLDWSLETWSNGSQTVTFTDSSGVTHRSAPFMTGIDAGDIAP